ncbi:hypothetical protein KI387_002301 [Taxus chinensis]|uniref:Uncharacterized protein n=1 Tax=Taxus chinensis TaxID=29808 RepID=A0AA38GXL5_TAXCH|nr:hypothetical protein KI387_002301 [Taxus chinensis]
MLAEDGAGPRPRIHNYDGIHFHSVEELDAKAGSHKNIPPKNTSKNQNQNLCEDELKVTVADMKARGPLIPCRDRVVEAKKNPQLSSKDKCRSGGEKAVVLYTTLADGAVLIDATEGVMAITLSSLIGLPLSSLV